MMTKIGFDLLVAFEGMRLNAYLDPAGIPTIGLGATHYGNGTKVKLGDTITYQEAVDLTNRLIEDTYGKFVTENLAVKLTDNQVDALISLCYNIGPGNLGNSTVWRLINESAPRSEIENAWRMWNKSGGRVLKGLTNRRDRELKHYYSHLDAMQEFKDGDINPTVVQPSGKLDFLYSPSFWSMFIGAIAMMFGDDGTITMPEVYKGLMTLSAGFTGIYVVDKNLKRFAEAIKK